MTNEPPQFFRFTDAAIGDERVPRAKGHGFALENVPCPVCGSRWQRYVGEGVYSIERGATWTDAISVSGGYPPFLVSERVAEGLEKIGATGFELLPVRIAEVQNKQLRPFPQPEYFYLSVTGQIDIDREASGMRGGDWCPTCKGNTSRQAASPARQVIPVPNSWDGSDIFKIGPRPMWGTIYCTCQVLELARRDRWTNFRFEPLDILQRHISMWGGIDYLGPEWPPKQWYPTPPSAGKTLAEWLELMRGDDPEAVRLARIAVSDIAYDKSKAVIPELVKMLDSPDEKFRRHAARMLGLIHGHSGPLPIDVQHRIKPLVSDHMRSKLD